MGALGAWATRTAQELKEAQQKLAGTETALGEAQKRREAKTKQERALQATHEQLKAELAMERQRQEDEAKELDKLLSLKAKLLVRPQPVPLSALGAPQLLSGYCQCHSRLSAPHTS